MTASALQDPMGGPSNSLETDAAAGDAAEAALRNREHVLRELVETEMDYVNDLSLVCDGYMKQMEVSALFAAGGLFPPVPEM